MIITVTIAYIREPHTHAYLVNSCRFAEYNQDTIAADISASIDRTFENILLKGHKVTAIVSIVPQVHHTYEDNRNV